MRAERTIEELLELDTAALVALPIEEIEKWAADALTKQDQILGKVPASKGGPVRVNLTGKGAVRQRTVQDALAQAPADVQELFKKQQEMFNKIKGLV